MNLSMMLGMSGGLGGAQQPPSGFLFVRDADGNLVRDPDGNPYIMVQP